MSFYLVVNLVGQSETRIKHGQEETFDFQSGIQLGLNDLDGIQ